MYTDNVNFGHVLGPFIDMIGLQENLKTKTFYEIKKKIYKGKRKNYYKNTNGELYKKCSQKLLWK